MSIKDNIKEELLDYINTEQKYLDMRIALNNETNADNFDCQCEQSFLNSLKEFAKSI